MCMCIISKGIGIKMKNKYICQRKNTQVVIHVKEQISLPNINIYELQ